ncbi:MAG: tetratricopeptide repeat protein [Panacagrimonas sp.]
MKPCARTCRSWMFAGLVLVLASGCAKRNTKPDRPVAAPPVAEKPAEPQAPPADKGDPEARFVEALQFMKQKKVKEAEVAFISLAKDFPDFSGTQTNLGILFAKSNRRDGAIAAFTRAATLNGDNASAFNWLGILNRETGNFDRARQSYEKAIAIKPDYAAAQLNLGLLLEDHMKQPAAALPHYKEYQRITGGKDLRVLPWIAEIESKIATAAAAAPPAVPVEQEKEVK